MIVSLTNPVYGQSTSSSEKTFFCQADETMPTTLAKASNGEDTLIFNWNKEVFPPESNVQEICDSVSEKLENYFTSKNNLSSLSFQTTQIGSIPAICLTDAEKNCNLVLLTLGLAEEPLETANLVLDSILNPQLQEKKAVSSQRGVQSTLYTVNLWDLLGF
ncbi:MAG: COP23 domain-containing protein [Xenococcus sp. (in: cyanobacteria)]